MRHTINIVFRPNRILTAAILVIWTLALSGMAASGYIQTASAAIASTATVTNFNGNNQQITKFDTSGKGIDAHDGDMAYFGGKYYLYGTSYGCGYELQTNGTSFCGFKSYMSTDLTNWTDNGLLFDGRSSNWHANCSPPRYGCYRPHVLYNNASGKYVLWINSYDNASGFHVFTATTPSGPFTEIAQPSVADMGTPGGFVNGDFDLFADDNGDGYIVYTDINYPLLPGGIDHTLRIQRLNSTYTSGTGPAISTATAAVEAPSLFKRNGVYYLLYGPGCAYCGGTPTVYKTAAAAMGSWSETKQINPTSCGGQPSFVSRLPTAAGGSVFVYGSDLWNSRGAGTSPVGNQALANFFWTPLAFSGADIQPFSCARTVTIPLGPNAQVGGPVNPTGLDQRSGAREFRPWCDISYDWSRAQSFTAGRSGTLSSISLDTFQSGRPNAELFLRVYRADASGTPINPQLWYGSVPPSFISWAPTTFVAQPNIPVTSGQRYAIVAESDTTTGCYGWEFNDSNPYAGGNGFYKVRGQNWTAEPGRDLKFLTTVR